MYLAGQNTAVNNLVSRLSCMLASDLLTNLYGLGKLFGGQVLVTTVRSGHNSY